MSGPANPFATPNAPATLETLDSSAAADSPAKPPYLLAWFCFLLTATIGGAIAGGVAGAVLGGVLGVQGVPIEQIVFYGQIAGYVFSLPVSYLCFRWAVATFIVKKLVK